MRRIAFINEKGGTCKTTLAVHVAAYLAEKKGQRVLLVDLDTQGHAGKSLGLDVRGIAPNAFHLLTDDAVSLNEVIHSNSIPGLSLVPGYKELGDFPMVVAQRTDREERLLARVGSGHDYDVVIFDAPPSNGLMTRNIFVAATEIVVPVALTYLALD